MRRDYIRRALEPVLKRAVREFPAVVLTGPRQSGKTTLLKHLFGKTYGYVSLEPLDAQAAATADPRGFLRMHAPPVILDEVQHAPDLLPFIKDRIDERRSDAGRYVLSGSQNLLLLEKVTESLAGCAAVLRLLPLSQAEALDCQDAPLPWEAKGEMPFRKGGTYLDLWKSFLCGGYPEVVSNPDRDISLWHSSYIQTYLERDVRSLRQIGDLTQFQSFMRSLAARSGQLLNLSDMARDLGVAVNTIKTWISLLEATFQVSILRPYFTNISKRLVKAPKIYFTDAGTLCHLVGLRDPEHALSGPMAGGIFEAAVLSEIVKRYACRGVEPKVYFWRTSCGMEVDIVVEDAGKLIPIEVKLSATPRPAMAQGILAFRKDYAEKAGEGYVIHPGDVRLPLAPHVTALPFAEL